jgi:thiosulfate dehydrogenase
VRQFLLGVAVGLAVIAVSAFVYFRFGIAPVAVSAHPMPFEQRFAHWALESRIHSEMPRTVPIAADAATYAAGAKVYVENCAMCHGLPKDRAAPFAQALAPRPPQLFQGDGVTDDPPGETYWKITNGIRLTGMPSFNRLLDATERWQVALLLAHAHELPPEVRTSLETATLGK